MTRSHAHIEHPHCTAGVAGFLDVVLRRAMGSGFWAHERKNETLEAREGEFCIVERCEDNASSRVVPMEEVLEWVCAGSSTPTAQQGALWEVYSHITGVAVDRLQWALEPHTGTLDGDSRAHADAEILRHRLVAAAAADKGESGRLVSVVQRLADGRRGQPAWCSMTTEGGLSGDRWSNGKANMGAQISMMNIGVADAIACGQSIALFGDNLFTDLDLSEQNLPAASLLQVGSVQPEVSAMPHIGCNQFLGRFGRDAFHLSINVPRVRGVYLTVVVSGEAGVGDAVLVLRRGPAQ